MEILGFFILWIVARLLVPIKKRKAEVPPSPPQEDSPGTLRDILREIEKERRKRGVLRPEETSFELPRRKSSRQEGEVYREKEITSDPENFEGRETTIDFHERVLSVMDEETVEIEGLKKKRYSEQKSLSAQKKRRIRFSPVAIEKGIIWAEILQEPRARRPITHILDAKGRGK